MQVSSYITGSHCFTQFLWMCKYWNLQMYVTNLWGVLVNHCMTTMAKRIALIWACFSREEEVLAKTKGGNLVVVIMQLIKKIKMWRQSAVVLLWRRRGLKTTTMLLPVKIYIVLIIYNLHIRRCTCDPMSMWITRCGQEHMDNMLT